MPIDDEKLLLAEYCHFGDGIFKNEEIGERRIEFFMTIATAVLGGVVFLFKDKHESFPKSEIQLLAMAALLGLFLMGFVTLLRILQRDRVTREYKKIQRYLRELLQKRSVSLEEYELPFAKRSRPILLRGGLAVTTAVINSLVLAFFVGIWTLGMPRRIHLAVGCFILTWVAQAIAIVVTSKGPETRRPETPRLEPPRLEPPLFFRVGAGAVILNGRGQVLAFERKDVAGAWQLPQGGLEPGESPLEAAYREIDEETGIKKDDLRLLSSEPVLLHYELPPKDRTAKNGRGQINYWFLFSYNGPDTGITLGEKKEFNDWKWTTLEHLAAEVVAFKRSVYEELLKRWAPELQRLPAKSQTSGAGS
jgi:putative (di)nucleoside polyphosphate hydrolase